MLIINVDNVDNVNGGGTVMMREEATSLINTRITWKMLLLKILTVMMRGDQRVNDNVEC